MNTGHGGSMGTTHANTPYDGLVRLETLAMMGDTNVPPAAIRRQISAASTSSPDQAYERRIA